MKPILKGRLLTCTYTGNRFDAAMDAAEEACRVSGDASITVITFPHGSKTMEKVKWLPRGHRITEK